MQPPTSATAVIPDYASWLNTEAVAKQLGVSYAQANAWIVNGAATENGRLKLRAVKIGSRWKVKPEWIVEFVDATTAAAQPKSATTVVVPTAPAPSAPRAASSSDRRRRYEAAMAKLGRPIK